MPLESGKSMGAFKHNIKTEMHAGKPMKQSLAIAYAMKRKHRKYAEGGFVKEEAAEYDPTQNPMPKGNERAMRETDRDLNQHGAHEVGDTGEDRENTPHEDTMGKPEDIGGEYESDEHAMDMVGRIMKAREQHYAQGGMVDEPETDGQVANDTPPDAEFEDNQFDDLVKDDNLHYSNTGANSGDDCGDEQEDEDRNDIVNRVMKSRRKTPGHNPRPA